MSARRRAHALDPRFPAAEQVRAAVEVLGGLVPGREPDAEPAGVAEARRADLLATAYRLLFAELAEAVGAEVPTRVALDGLALATTTANAWDEADLALIDRARGRLRADPAWVEAELTGLGRLHEELLAWRLVPDDEADEGAWSWREEGRDRKAGGVYFTPPALVDHLLDETLEVALDGGAREGAPPLRVVDPACGAGAFLVSAARRLRRRALRAGADPVAARRAALAAVHGVDLDRAVLELARCCLWLEVLADGGAPGAWSAEELVADVPLVTGDAVLGLGWPVAFPGVFTDTGAAAGTFEAGAFAAGDFEVGAFDVGRAEAGGGRGGFDVVVGNPPFANQLERLTARDRVAARALGAGGGVAAYTDLSAVFLLRSLEWARPGGRVGLVQPQSLLSARDAAPVRRAVTRAGALVSLWSGRSGIFDAAVPTCAVVVAVGEQQGAVRRWHGADVAPLPPRDLERVHLEQEWGFLLAASLGIPEVALTPPGTLGDLADCTADFRDQYYGLGPFVRDVDEAAGAPAPPAGTVPLVTSGLIDPAACLWGVRGTRFLKRTWAAPAVDLDDLQRDEKLAGWAARRLVPKLLVATQGKVLEAVADETGAWLPSVPVVTVRPHADADLWRLLAVLLAPPVCALAASRYAGTALNPAAIKLSAKQVAALPLPTVEEAWARGAEEVRSAQAAPGPADRHAALVRAGRHLCTAYGVDGTAAAELLAWWSARLPTPTP